MRVIWAESALADVREARRYIARDNPAAAQKTARRIGEVTQTLLAEHPYLGRAGRIDGTRELVVPSTPYIVVYRVQDGNLYVARVIHSARKWPESL